MNLFVGVCEEEGRKDEANCQSFALIRQSPQAKLGYLAPAQLNYNCTLTTAKTTTTTRNNALDATHATTYFCGGRNELAAVTGRLALRT